MIKPKPPVNIAEIKAAIEAGHAVQGLTPGRGRWLDVTHPRRLVRVFEGSWGITKAERETYETTQYRVKP